MKHLWLVTLARIHTLELPANYGDESWEYLKKLQSLSLQQDL